MMLVDYATGNLTQAATYPAVGTGWTNMVSAPNGVVLIYDATGKIATDGVDDSGQAIALKRYTYKP